MDDPGRRDPARPADEKVGRAPFDMAPPDVRCTTSGVALGGRGTTVFLCPDCGSVSVGRCARCRDQSVLYTCPKCGFQGP